MRMGTGSRAWHMVVAVIVASAGALAAAHAEPIEPESWLVIGSLGQSGRGILHTNAIHAAIAAGTWATPRAGDEVVLPDGAVRTWEEVGDGGVRLQAEQLRGGFALATFLVEHEGEYVLTARAHSSAYVGGRWRAGDPYNTGWMRAPMHLEPGRHGVLLSCRRGFVEAVLNPVEHAAYFDTADTTLPDAVRGEAGELLAGIVLVNTTDAPLRASAVAALVESSETLMTELAVVPAETSRKVTVRLPAPPPDVGAVAATYRIGLEGERAAPIDISLKVVEPGELTKRTFVSEIDGSVQYYAERRSTSQSEKPQSLIVSLHGAGVEGRGQAACHEPKDWAHVVSPTNRRPFGFDWEDWGRLDLLEVLGLAFESLHADPRRTYLTGHSMGGHGTWINGVLFADRWAGIGPSAGWESFAGYTGWPEWADTPAVEMLERARSVSDPLPHIRNLAALGVYVLHGDADDNVPVERARAMRERLAEFHPDFAYYERAGAGHWWGNRCVDWPEMIEFFSRRSREADADAARVRFSTPNPGVSSQCRWATICTQIESLKPSVIDLRWNAGTGAVSGTTENVRRLTLDAGTLMSDGRPHVEITLDGTTLNAEAANLVDGRIWLEREPDGWVLAAEASASLKTPVRAGPFKEAFNHRFVLVYGTGGTAEENEWAHSKARFDAETFAYRGNGSVDVVSDVEFDPGQDRDRSVILYGNEATNAMWAFLLDQCPVELTRGRIAVGDRAIERDDLACLFVRPRAKSDMASVAVVGGTGVRGMRLTDTVPYFVSGAHLPDWIVLSPRTLVDASAGVLGAGFFDEAWRVDPAQSGWLETGDR